QQLDIGMTGHGIVDYSANVLFRSAELRSTHHFRDALRFVLIDDAGTWGTLWAVNGKDLWRLTVYGADRETISKIDGDAAIARLTMPGLPYTIEYTTRWTRRAATAARMQHGRVFLA